MTNSSESTINTPEEPTGAAEVTISLSPTELSAGVQVPAKFTPKLLELIGEAIPVAGAIAVVKFGGEVLPAWATFILALALIIVRPITGLLSAWRRPEV